MDISTIGRYQILERLGQGGMGVVYRAFDPQIERTVAIKVISTQLVDQPEHRERFFREARAAGRLAHRNIITIFDLGEDRGQPYIAMEYVEGQAARRAHAHGRAADALAEGRRSSSTSATRWRSRTRRASSTAT